MQPRLALSIGVVSFLLTGVLFVLAPAQGMSAVGWPAPPTEVPLPSSRFPFPCQRGRRGRTAQRCKARPARRWDDSPSAN